ncbi:YesL family protein [Metabacillus mangrovi]|nr:DUF624 domain-containing protein [Metabacillus mangrovi]
MATGLYRTMEWIMKLVYVQVLWLGFTLAGLGGAGIFPATVSMYTVLRKWLQGESDVPILAVFKKTWRKDWLIANQIGWSFLAAGFVLYFYLRAAMTLGGTIGMVLYFLAAISIFIFILAFLFVFPVYVHFQAGFVKAVRLAFLFALSHPFHSLSMIAAVCLFYLLAGMLPVLMLFLGSSLFSLSIMTIAKLAFIKAGAVKPA